MGDSSTKPEFWLVTLGFIIVISYALLMFGNSLSNNDNATLDSDSTTYLSNYTARLDKVGITAEAEKDLDEDRAKNPITKALGGIIDFFDVFGVFTLLKNIFVGLWTFIALMFNMPSFIIESLGLPLANFKFIVNTFVSVLILSATILIARLVK